MPETDNTVDTPLLWVVLLTVIITSLIVGGAIYLWQQSILDEKQESLQEEIASLQEQLQDDTSSELTASVTVEDTSDTAGLFDQEQWITYENTDIGFSFSYPAEFGDFEVVVNDGDVGKQFVGSFEDRGYFYIGGITEDYTYPRGGHFLDFTKYLSEDGEYYHLAAIEKRYLLEPVRTLLIDEQTVLIVDGDSYVSERGVVGPTMNPGANGGALVNLPDTGDFTGMAIQNLDLESVPQELFEQILQTFDFSH